MKILPNRRAGIAVWGLVVISANSWAWSGVDKDAVVRGIAAHNAALAGLRIEAKRETSLKDDREFIRRNVAPENLTKIWEEPDHTQLLDEILIVTKNGLRSDWVRKDALVSPDKPENRGSICGISRVWTPSRYEELVWNVGSRTPAGGIRATGVPDFFATMDIALGIRVDTVKAVQWITVDALTNAVFTRIGDTHVAVRLSDFSGATHTLTYDTGLGYAPVKYERIMKDGTGVVLTECSDFREVAPKLMIPWAVKRVHRGIKSDGTKWMPVETTLKVTSAVIDPTKTDPESLMIEWPRGMSVLDVRSGTSIEIIDKPHVLTDEMIRDQAIRDKARPEPR